MAGKLNCKVRVSLSGLAQLKPSQTLGTKCLLNHNRNGANLIPGAAQQLASVLGTTSLLYHATGPRSSSLSMCVCICVIQVLHK